MPPPLGRSCGDGRRQLRKSPTRGDDAGAPPARRALPPRRLPSRDGPEAFRRFSRLLRWYAVGTTRQPSGAAAARPYLWRPSTFSLSGFRYGSIVEERVRAPGTLKYDTCMAGSAFQVAEPAQRPPRCWTTAILIVSRDCPRARVRCRHKVLPGRNVVRLDSATVASMLKDEVSLARCRACEPRSGMARLDGRTRCASDSPFLPSGSGDRSFSCDRAGARQ